MIFGIGTDLVEIKRIESINSIDKFANKILSKNELSILKSLKEEKKITFLSKQFPGKEAISKAIGTGITKQTRFKDIEILRDENGKPILNAIDGFKKYMNDLGITKTHVSLSDERNYAIAFAVLEK